MSKDALAGRFDLLGEIGSGSSGTVHRARTREAYRGLPPDTEVAVKFLRQDRLSDPVARRRLLAEGRLGQRLRSPYVARIHGVETLELMGLETTYLVMELVEGSDLRILLNRSGPVIEDLARRIGMDAALGLEALHRLGVVHRDLKPENLAISPAGHVKLMDLGLATGHSPDASREGFVGSVTYAAPEVLRGRPATPRSDLYSLGVVLFEVATGRHPFAHHTAVDDLLLAHLEEAPPRASHVRPRVSTLLESLIDDLLAKDPKMRPPSARELAHTLQLAELSPYWRERELRVPVLASRRRLNRMRRPTPTPFVGRTAELQQLDQAISGAIAGRGTALCIQGADGVGRRRLLDEALSRMLDAPDAPRFLGGEAVPGLSEGHGLPFSRMLLEWCLRGDHPDSPKAPDRVAIRLQREAHMADEDAAKLAAILTGEPRDDPPEVRADLLARGFLQLSTIHPLALRVDRTEQLGTTGRLVLERLVDEAPGHRLVVLTVAGSTEDASFRGETVPLGPMTPAELAALGRSLFRSGAVKQEFLDTAHRTLAGNPGNLMDALSHLADRGKLEGQPGHFHGLKVAAAPPAPPLLSRLAVRVGGLPSNERRILHGAAVLGERFRIAELTSLTAATELHVLEALSALPGGVIRAVQGGGRFLHRDYRRALLRGVPDRERRSLHRAAAQIAASRGAGPLEVGLHLSRAGEHQECLEPLLEALEQLVRRRSRRSSARLLARIRVHLEAAPDNRENRRRRLRFLLLAARVVPAADRGERAMQYYRQASVMARELEEHASLGEALTGMATLALESGQFFAAQSLLERTHLALERSQGGREAAARAFGLHARVMAYLCQPNRGLHYLRRALRILPPREVGQLTHILVDRARLERMGHHFDTALVSLNRADRLLRHHPSPIAELRVRLYRGQILAELNDKHAVSQLREASEEAHRLSNPRIQAKALLLRGDHELGRGNRGIAMELLKDAAQLGQRAQDRLTSSHALVLLGELGTPTPGLEETVHDLGAPSLKVAWLLGEAHRHAMAGRPEMVRVCADEAMDILGVVNLPLLLHLRVLQLSGADDEVRDLVQEVASHLPARISRHRFHAGVDRLTGETHS